MKIGTRGSELALWQARRVRALLQQATGVTGDLVVIQTTGDKDPYTPLSEIAGKQFFTKEIEDALLDGRIDLAVHSLKDLQTTMPDGLTLAAVVERADRRDVLLIRPESYDRNRPLRLRHGAKVGTSSSRRVSQLNFLRPDLAIEPMRGNVPRRIAKLRENLYQAILIAAAGIDRLGHPLDDPIEYRLPESLMVPAPGQGALAVQTRADDEKTLASVQQIDDQRVRETVGAEREIQRLMEGGCQLALGVAADITARGYRLQSFLGTDDSARPRRIIVAGANVSDVQSRTIDYLKSVPKQARPDPATVWITREQSDPAFILALSRSQLSAKFIPVLQVIDAGDGEAQRRCLEGLGLYDWIFFTSQNAIQQFARLIATTRMTIGRNTRIAAIGKKSAETVRAAGWSTHFVADTADAKSMAEEFIREAAGSTGRVLFPCGASAGSDIDVVLTAGGFTVDRVICYDTVRHPALSAAIKGLPDPDAVVFTSPRAARFLLDAHPLSKHTIAVSIGPSTSDALLERNCAILYEACDRSLEGAAEVINGLFAS